MPVATNKVSKFAKQSRLSLPVFSASNEIADPSRLRSKLQESATLRSYAGEIRQHTLDHLDQYLAQLREQIERNGSTLVVAADSAAARSHIEAALETDRSEKIGIRAGPILEEIGFHTPSGPPKKSSDRVDALVIAGRFVIAETGQVCVVGPEPVLGSVAAVPKTIVAVLGLESILPRASDLAVMLKLLARTSPAGGLPRSIELLGRSQAVRVVLVDNGRSAVLAGPHRSALRCIGCGACRAVCPVYDQTEAGSPISAILSPLLKGDSAFDTLPFASTLCGACSEVCPVEIDLPHQLVLLRQSQVAGRNAGFPQWLRKLTTKSPGWKHAAPLATEPAAESFSQRSNVVSPQ